MKVLSEWTVDAYKQLHDGDVIEIIKSPKTGKFFFTCGYNSDGTSYKGAVSKEVAELAQNGTLNKENIKVLRFQDEKNGNVFDCIVKIKK